MSLQKEILSTYSKNEFKSEISNLNDNFFGQGTDDLFNTKDDEVEDEEDEETSSSISEYNADNIDVDNIIKKPQIFKTKVKEQKKINQSSLINDINSLVKLLTENEVTISDGLKSEIKRMNSRTETANLRETYEALNDLYEKFTTSTYLTDWIIQAAVMACSVFNGENVIPFTSLKVNLTGYSARLKKKAAEINKQNMQIAGKVNSVLGKDIISLFQWFSLLILPLCMTISANHGSQKMIDYDKGDNLDSDNDESENSEGSDETSEYESD